MVVDVEAFSATGEPSMQSASAAINTRAKVCFIFCNLLQGPESTYQYKKFSRFPHFSEIQRSAYIPWNSPEEEGNRCVFWSGSGTNESGPGCFYSSNRRSLWCDSPFAEFGSNSLLHLLPRSDCFHQMTLQMKQHARFQRICDPSNSRRVEKSAINSSPVLKWTRLVRIKTEYPHWWYVPLLGNVSIITRTAPRNSNNNVHSATNPISIL